MRKMIVLTVLITVFGAVLAGQQMGCSADQDVEEPELGDVGLVNVFGPELVDAGGNSTSSAVLKDNDYVLLYFSAESCPSCREFTPKLVDFYEKYAEEGNFEVVFISLDDSESDMYDYMEGYNMEWFAMPYDRSDASDLAEKYLARNTPALVNVSPEGYVLRHSAGERGPFQMLNRLADSFRDRR